MSFLTSVGTGQTWFCSDALSVPERMSVCSLVEETNGDPDCEASASVLTQLPGGISQDAKARMEGKKLTTRGESAVQHAGHLLSHLTRCNPQTFSCFLKDLGKQLLAPGPPLPE